MIGLARILVSALAVLFWLALGALGLLLLWMGFMLFWSLL